MTPISILDLVPVILDETPREALRKSLDLIQHAERFGYKRFWVAEHHNMTGIASAAHLHFALQTNTNLLDYTSASSATVGSVNPDNVYGKTKVKSC